MSAPSLPSSKSSLSAYTWDEIKILGDALSAGVISTSDLSSKYNISVGSTKTSTIAGESHSYRIVDFMHDVDASDNTLGMTFEQEDLLTTTYTMYQNGTTSMASTDGYLNSTVQVALANMSIASDLSAVITPAKKTVGTSVSDGTATTVTQKLWNMAEIEVFGTTSYSKCTKEGTRYAYYTNGGSAIKNLSGTATNYWLRSPYGWLGSLFGSRFASVNADGTVSYSSASRSYGVAPCFCIGDKTDYSTIRKYFIPMQ